MIDKRRVRFACIDGLQREDIGLAAEIWHDDIVRQSWATRDMIKLSTVFKRYMTSSDPVMMTLRSIERRCQLDRKALTDAVRAMQIFGVIEAFSFEEEVLRASLTLTLMQRLRVLEAKSLLIRLGGAGALATDGHAPREEKWIPEHPQDAADDDAAMIAPFRAA